MACDKFVTSVKVGPKGQIVIPGEARKLFSISPGDSLLFIVDGERGMAIAKMEAAAPLIDGSALEGDAYREFAAEVIRTKVRKE
jgi:AbrB family looped-hinge helix DNA binding protein